MDNTVFTQSVSTIRFMETKLLDRAKLEALVASKDFEDALRLLQDSRYTEYLSTGSYEEGLKRALEELYREMYKTTPIKEVVDLLAARYDGHNLKSLVKSKLKGIESDNILVNAGTISIDKLKFSVKEENFRDIPQSLRRYVEMALEEFKNQSNPQIIDILIDRGVYEYMLEIAKNSNLKHLVEITRVLIDNANLKAFIRIKVQDRGRELFEKVFIPGGSLDKDAYISSLTDSLDNFSSRLSHTDYYKWLKPGIEEYLKTNDLGKIEKLSDNFLVDYIKRAKLVSFGPDPIIAYIIARENEIKILRIILTGKKNDLEPENIRERLRDVYV